ncbi:unnamed protein product [Rhizoctonia solani]|uniref:DUF6535 domain-containing protein n=1 Tax=Rhizoctonia solani TaxID=456999 RepID=A0A8H3BTS9_9AGAM|nr:unnamed protein product [Rhizoctonia solani]
MLVKQWGEGYRSGQGLTAPYIQARTRQARYDKLKDWRTEDIVLILPVVMHAALGLFLFGLIIFLKDLSRVVLIPVAIVVALTAVVYFITTLLPLAVTFCPYNTPLSSERLWNYFVQKLGQYRIVRKDTWSTTSRQEDKIINDATPDRITTRALEWLISHGQNWETVDRAIEALSNSVLKPETWNLLAQHSLVILVAQRFTAIFSGVLDYDTDDLQLEDESQIKQAALYGRLLVNLAKHHKSTSIASTDADITRSRGLEATDFPSEGQVIAVERGLSLVSFNPINDSLAAQGVVCLSAWYSLTNRTNQTAKKWEHMLDRLVKVLLTAPFATGIPSEPVDMASPQPLISQFAYSSNAAPTPYIESPSTFTTRKMARTDNIYQRNHNQAHTAPTTNGGTDHLRNPTSSSTMFGHASPSDARATSDYEELSQHLKALVTEISQWKWDADQDQALHSLLRLFGSSLIHGPGRAEFSATLAIFAMLFNNYPDTLGDDILTSPTAEGQNDILSLRPKSPDDHEHKYDGYPPKLREAKRRLWRAKYAAEICTTQPEYLKKYTDSFLLLGLGGLLDSFTVLGLTGSAPDVVKIVASGLDKISPFTLSEPMNLPYILPASFDLRTYILDVITRALNPSPFEVPSEGLQDCSKATLLRHISQKKLWANFGHQLILPTVQLLHTSNDIRLQMQCLDGLDECCETHGSYNNHETGTNRGSDLWQTLFAFNVPYRVLELIKVSDDDELRSKALNSFCSITSIIPNSKQCDVSPQMIKVLKKLSLADLLDTLVEIIVGKWEHGHDMHIWKQAIELLPCELNSMDKNRDDQIRNNLKAFCDKHHETPGFGLIVLGLRQGMSN